VRLGKPKPLVCPQCGERIWRGSLGRSLNKWECPHCGAHVGIASSYELSIGALSFLSAVLIGAVTHRQDSDGTWLLGVIAAAAVIHMALMVSIPPWLKLGSYQTKATVVSSFLGAAMYMFLLGLLALGAFTLHTASKQDLQENLEMLSGHFRGLVVIS
jgi:hypothetical protein